MSMYDIPFAVDNSKFGHDYVPRVNLGGNFCGHNRLKPTLSYLSENRSGKKDLPRVLTLMIERSQQYFKFPHRLPSLNFANNSKRQQRSERREACLRALSAMLECVDITTLKVGIPEYDGFFYYKNEPLAERARLHPKRFQRALKDLVDAGIVTVTKRVEEKLDEDGNPVLDDKGNLVYRSLPSIKCISQFLFKAFGLDKALKKERKRTSEKSRENNQNKYSSNANARFNLSVRSGIAKAKRANAKKKCSVSTETHGNHTVSQEYQEAVQRLTYQLRTKFTNLSAENAEYTARQHLSNLQNYLKFTQK